ncbi:hypothetical protein B7494_g8226 [Chlorociboria aeruginascens]|nr:hypothetical protein B7494_g8226 [Chlorociboria aeruginascens]
MDGAEGPIDHQTRRSNHQYSRPRLGEASNRTTLISVTIIMTMDLDLLIPGDAKNTLAMSSDEIFARKGGKELQVLYEKRDELTKKIETIEKQINNERVVVSFHSHAQKFYKLLGSRSTIAYINVDIDFIYLFKPPSSQSLSDPGPDITTVDGVNFVEHVI